jgi:hypothetical protein
MAIKLQLIIFLLALWIASCSSLEPIAPSDSGPKVETPQTIDLFRVSRVDYADKLEGFWLGQSIANWTGLVTEMDKIGGEGEHGQFYTRDDWGSPDQPSIWGQGVPSNLSTTINWVLEDSSGIWGSDDDTDIEYMYQHLMEVNQVSILSAEQIRDGWLTHIYSEENTPLVSDDGSKENFLWVSNQQAHDLMQQGMLPPKTGDPAHNPHFDMIDAQLTTEIFGLLAPARPDIALKIATLPIQTTARENAQWASEFYIIMHSLASYVDPSLSNKQQVMWLAQQARTRLPQSSYSAHMYDFVMSQHKAGKPWEKVRDALHQRYQVEQQDGYNITAKNLYCNGCFASGINFAASLVSLFYGEGDYKKTIQLAVLMGWDSDNPAATWGGLLGFMNGKQEIEKLFSKKLSNRFNIHRTRGNFDNNGIDNFTDMAEQGITIVDRVVTQQMGGQVDVNAGFWLIPKAGMKIKEAQYSQ